MRVLITNSLVLAAISLAPSASAAPYSAISSVDSYDSYPNSTAVAQDPGSSSVPSMLYPYGRTITISRPTSPLDVRRGEVIHIESLYDGSPFGNVFGPVADLFNSMGMTTISDSTPLTDAQKLVLGQLENALNGAAGSVIAHLPANLPLPVSPRSLEDRQIPDPLAVLSGLPFVGGILAPISDLLSSAGLGSNSATSLTDTQKQVVDKLQTAILNAVGTVAANIPVLPLSHQSRSVEERSLEDIISFAGNAPILGRILAPAIALMKSTGVTNGTPLNDAQKLVLSRLQDAIAGAAKNIQYTVHTEHARGEPEHWTQDHHNDPHPHSHDDRKDDHGSQDDRKNDHGSQDTREDDHGSQDVREDGRGSPEARKEDRDAQRADRGGNRCREPRDGQRDEMDRWDDWRHRGDGRDRDEESLLKINLGHSCRP